MNVLKKIAEFAYNHIKIVREAVDNHRGVQEALERADDFKVNEIQITNWILDEADRAQQRVHGFDIMIGTYENLKENMPRTIELTNAYLLKKVGILSHIGFVKRRVNKLAESTAASVVNSMLGQTCWLEKGDQKDLVIIYPSQLRSNWWSVAIHGEGIEDITRQIVRHEFRHAEQIIALRRFGGEDLVKKVVAIDETLPYQERIMERDAWEGQSLPEYRPIDEFVDEALAAIAAHKS